MTTFFGFVLLLVMALLFLGFAWAACAAVDHAGRVGPIADIAQKGDEEID
jgi:hypothetical protein